MARLALRYGFPGGIWSISPLKGLDSFWKRRFEIWEGHEGFLLLPLKIGGHMASDCGWRLELSTTPAGICARRGSPHSYSWKELNSPNLKEIGSGILYLLSPAPATPTPAKLLSLASALISVMPWQGIQPCHTQTSDIQNQELMNRCCSGHQAWKYLSCRHRDQDNKSQVYADSLSCILITFQPGPD